MFVIIRSEPGTPEARKGVKLARDRAADLLLIRDGAYHVRKDARQRGIGEREMERGIKTVSTEEMIELLAGAEEVAGPF